MENELKIQNDVELAPRTTFRIGGKARYFVEARSEDEVSQALRAAEERGLEVFVLGGGSNVLVSDEGFEGLVVGIAIEGISLSDESTGPEAVLVTAGAGEDWDSFVEWCVANELSGIECLSGIPGLVGGTPIQNVGAYGQEVSESVISVRALDRRSLEVIEIPGKDCEFGYRSSIFNSTKRDQYVVLAVTYRLLKSGKPKIAYQDLANLFRGREPSLSEIRSAVCSIRTSKGMMVRQGGPDSQSAGSFFKNPVLDNPGYERLVKGLQEKGVLEPGGSVPCFETVDGRRKVPAAWLIERAGFPKGYQNGNAGLSTRHTLALTNRGGASSAEILALREEIRRSVRRLSGIELEQEPTLVGFSSTDPSAPV